MRGKKLVAVWVSDRHKDKLDEGHYLTGKPRTFLLESLIDTSLADLLKTLPRKKRKK